MVQIKLHTFAHNRQPILWAACFLLCRCAGSWQKSDYEPYNGNYSRGAAKLAEKIEPLPEIRDQTSR